MKTIAAILACFIFVANLASCSKKEEAITGYAEGRLAYIASPYSGYLQDLFVRRGEEVKTGQKLFALEGEPETFTIAAAKDNINILKNELNIEQSILNNINTQLQRRERLAANKFIEEETVENYRVEYKNNSELFYKIQAQINNAQTSLKQANWTLAKKSAHAKKDGIVFDTYFLTGEFVVTNQPIVSILSPDETYIVFFVETKELAQLKLGMPIQYSCDGMKEKLPAKISYIAPKAEFTPPVLYGTDLRSNLTYRIEAISGSVKTNCLHPGQPLDIYLKP